MSNVSFLLIDIPPRNGSPSLIKEWQDAFAQHLEPKDLERFSFLECGLNRLQAETQVTFDCIVSPANSYGIMDGGFVSNRQLACSCLAHVCSGLIFTCRWLSPHRKTFMLLLALSRLLSEIAITASHHQVHAFLCQASHQIISLARLSPSAPRCATHRN